MAPALSYLDGFPRGARTHLAPALHLSHHFIRVFVTHHPVIEHANPSTCSDISADLSSVKGLVHPGVVDREAPAAQEDAAPSRPAVAPTAETTIADNAIVPPWLEQVCLPEAPAPDTEDPLNIAHTKSVPPRAIK